MDSAKQQLSERLKQANNVLVTVSANPSVDQLASCIGLTLVLNHMGKHATAVFSGEVPSTLEFLKPEDTLEKNTDSLRDFIISLDKSKADKLRYKVEDKVVKIFITPYRTSISDQDLEFSQGDFNVDVVVALGVHQQQELDQAITSHGRILHDATVATINTSTNSNLGSLNWVDTRASSLSELVVQLTDVLDKEALDVQTATALLTGIVAATDRFSNDKTSPQTMSASAELMAAGANQQLIATKLETPEALGASLRAGDKQKQDAGTPESAGKKEPGELDIDHDAAKTPPEPAPEPHDEFETPQPQVQIDEHGQLITLDAQKPDEEAPEISTVRGVSSEGEVTESNIGDEDVGAEPTSEVTRTRLTEPPKMGGQLTANSADEGLDPSTDPLTLPSVESSSSHTPLLSHNGPSASLPTRPEPPEAPETAPTDSTPPITPDETLAEIEKSVDSPHLLDKTDTAAPNVDDARNAVEAALNASAQPLSPTADLNSLPLGPELHDTEPTAGPINTGFSEPVPGGTPADQSLDMPMPAPGGSTFPGAQTPPPSAFPGAPQQGSDSENLPPAPPVPPPMLPPM